MGYDDKFRKIPFSAEEILPVARDLALQAETGGLITMAADSFPRCRAVTTGKYINEDFTEISIATRGHTRKCAEIQAQGKATVFWQDKTGSGAWVSAACTGVVEPGDRDDGKAKVRLTVQRIELQDYNANITGNGLDCWAPCVLERANGVWQKTQ